MILVYLCLAAYVDSIKAESRTLQVVSLIRFAWTQLAFGKYSRSFAERVPYVLYSFISAKFQLFGM